MPKGEESKTKVAFREQGRSQSDSNSNINSNQPSVGNSVGGALNEGGKDDAEQRDSFIPDSKEKQPGDLAEDHTQLLNTFLTFKTADLESEFSNYFVNLNLPRWRRTISTLFIILSALYVYLIARNTVESVEYEAKYSPIRKTGSSLCPNGFFCGPCNPDMICTSYDPVFDATFWFVLVLIPYAVALISCYYVKAQTFAESIDIVTAVVVFLQVFAGIGVRYFVMEAQQNFLQPTILMNVIMMLAFVGLRPRFVYQLSTLVLISAVWIIMSITSLAITGDGYKAGAYGIGLLCMIISSVVLTFSAYETEHFYRIQFLQSKEMKKNNAKLKNQLNLLAKSYNQQAVKSLDSPLERSMMIIRSVMADPSLYSRHLLALGQVTSLLASSNLLTPDFEGTVAETMDNEQQAWLFSEIAARRRKGRGKSNYRRKLSLTQDVAQKIGNSTIKEFNVLEEEPSQMEEAPIATPPPAVLSDDRRYSHIMQDPRAVYPPTIEEIQAALTRYNDYDYNLFELSKASGNRSLSLLSHHLFAQAKLFEAFGIPVEKFGNCITAIEKGYHADLPYHNSLHASDVLHCMHHLANTAKVKDIWSDIELLAMYFAAIIHDHDHPGLTNNFLVTTSDPKAVLYNDKAVLENHHSASSFLVLAKPENNFLAHLTKAEFKSIREVVIDLVLATDLTQHFTLLSMFKSKAASPETFDPYESREDRMLLFKIMIKCSDVSNPTKDLSIYKPWCRLIMTEFMMQGDMEKKLSIPVSPYMDRDNVNVPSCQIGFIDYVVQPLFGALDSYQPIPSIINRLAKNREYWGNLKLQGVTNIPEEKPSSRDLSQTENSTKHVVVDIQNKE